MIARPSRTRFVVLLVLVGLALPAVAPFFGFQIWQSVLLAAIAASVVGLILFRPSVEEPFWWPEAVSIDPSQGARRDVARLSWNVSGDRAVGRTLLLRLHDLAERRLARLGLALDDPADRDAVIDRLGPQAYRVLDPQDRAEVSLAAFDAALRSVEDLGSVLDDIDRGSNRA